MNKKCYKVLKILFLVIFLFGGGTLFATSAIALPAFPGAVGYGSDTIGGRGGTLIEVTNLNDSGTGSLRAALEASGPRIIVFRTGGTIDLNSDINVTNPYVTIAGQTAPGGGICVAGGYTIHLQTHDIIMRGMRLRPGKTSYEKDAIWMSNATAGSVYNIIVDHCSASWSSDEMVSFWYDAHDCTIMNTMIYEPLGCCHSESNHEYTMLAGHSAYNISVYRSLLAHGRNRNPRVTIDNFLFVNNIVYGRRWLGGEIESPSNRDISFVGNVFRRSNDENIFNASIEILNLGSGSNFWDNDNYCAGDTQEGDCVDYGPISRASSDPLSPWPGGMTAIASSDVLDEVLSDIGATVPELDAADTRMISQVYNQTGTIITDEDDVGGYPTLAAGTAPADTDHDGMPDDWETANGLDKNNPGDGNQDRDGDGYTNVEEYINGLITMADNTAPNAPTNVKVINTVTN